MPAPGEDAGSTVPPPPEPDKNAAQIQQSYIDDAARVAGMEYVKRRVERVQERLAKHDERLEKVRAQIAGMADRLKQLEQANDRDIAKLNNMIDSEFAPPDMFRTLEERRLIQREAIEQQSLQCEKSHKKYWDYRTSTADKAWDVIRKNSKEWNRERGYVPTIGKVKFLQQGLNEKQQEHVAQAEKRLRGVLSQEFRHRLDEVVVVSIDPSKKQRAHFKGRRHGGKGEEINLSINTNAATVVHEFGHALETNASVHALSQGFLYLRVGDEPAKALGKGFDPWEVGRDDDFSKTFPAIARYAGKHYKSDDTEILSMGMEGMFEDPVEFANRDPQYFKFVLGVMDGSLI